LPEHDRFGRGEPFRIALISDRPRCRRWRSSTCSAGCSAFLVDDAIAHGDERYRDTIMEWLAGMYELTMDALCGAGRAG
jgi:hypothetical protein